MTDNIYLLTPDGAACPHSNMCVNSVNCRKPSGHTKLSRMMFFMCLQSSQARSLTMRDDLTYLMSSLSSKELSNTSFVFCFTIIRKKLMNAWLQYDIFIYRIKIVTTELVSHNITVNFVQPQTLYCPASRTTLVATRFRVAVICPIIQVPHCIRVFFYFV